MKDDDPGSALTQKLAEYLETAFKAVHLGRQSHYAANPGMRPSVNEADAIVASYANQNGLIAGAANLVPGPLGTLAVLPELTLITRNQIQMVYDLGVAHGKEAQLTPEVLLAVVASAMDDGTAKSILAVQGGKLVIKQLSVKTFQKAILWIAKKTAQKVLKAIVAKYVPLLGAAAMALWARQATMSMGRKASALLASDIVAER
jgi:uncharacterized protein (DUF697 family)